MEVAAYLLAESIQGPLENMAIQVLKYANIIMGAYAIRYVLLKTIRVPTAIAKPIV